MRRALVVLCGVLVLVAPLSPSAVPMRAVQSLSVIAIALTAIIRWRRGGRQGWGIISTAALGWILALLAGWYSVVADSDRWHLNARWIFTAAALLAVVGLSRLLSAGSRRRDLIQAFDAVVVGASLAVVLGVLLADAIAMDHLRTLMQLPLLGPFATLCMLAYALTAAIYQPARRLAMWMSAGLALSLAGDLLQMVQLSHGVSPYHNAFSPLLAAGAVLMLVAVLAPDHVAVARGAVPRFRRPLLAGMVLTALAVETWDLAVNRTLRPIPLVAGALMVTAQTVALLLVMAELRSETRTAELAREDLARSEERLLLAIDASPVGIGVADDGGDLVLANRALGEMIGIGPDEIVGRNWSEFLANSTAESPELGDADRAGGVRRLIRLDGLEKVVDIDARQFPAADGEHLWFGTALDITDHLAVLRRLEHLASHDELTDLPNRRHFSRRLAEALGEGVEGVLVVCDLDQFKFVNDTLGHSAGDALLVALAQRLRALEQRGCTVARIGGDEFCVLVPACLGDPLGLVATAFRMPFDLGDGEVLHATASVGGTMLRRGANPEALVGEADAAMYRAKALGPGRREMYTLATGLSMAEHRRTIARLHHAVQHDELEVHYQPVADTMTAEIVSMEALLRWRDPERGLLVPADFVATAEQAGLIGGITERVLRIALEAASDPCWVDNGATLAVNVSPVEFTDDAFVDTVAAALRSAEFDPNRLWIELTESALLSDVRSARRSCRALRDLGVRLAIDDFGTGYGSLSYLVQFPVGAIKIDRSFVEGIDRPTSTDQSKSHDNDISDITDITDITDIIESTELHGRDFAVVQALVSLADGLGLQCVAEGVERESQLQVLRAMGCPLVQGYLVGRPLARPDFAAA